jgi:hypothetical protein
MREIIHSSTQVVSPAVGVSRLSVLCKKNCAELRSYKLTKAGRLFHGRGTRSFKMFLYGCAFFVALGFIYYRCRHVVTNKVPCCRGSHSGEKMQIRVKNDY